MSKFQTQIDYAISTIDWVAQTIGWEKRLVFCKEILETMRQEDTSHLFVRCPRCGSRSRTTNYYVTDSSHHELGGKVFPRYTINSSHKCLNCPTDFSITAESVTPLESQNILKNIMEELNGR